MSVDPLTVDWECASKRQAPTEHYLEMNQECGSSERAAVENCSLVEMKRSKYQHNIGGSTTLVCELDHGVPLPT